VEEEEEQAGRPHSPKSTRTSRPDGPQKRPLTQRPRLQAQRLWASRQRPRTRNLRPLRRSTSTQARSRRLRSSSPRYWRTTRRSIGRIGTTWCASLAWRLIRGRIRGGWGFRLALGAGFDGPAVVNGHNDFIFRGGIFRTWKVGSSEWDGGVGSWDRRIYVLDYHSCMFFSCLVWIRLVGGALSCVWHDRHAYDL